jgi:hypothetical protein
METVDMALIVSMLKMANVNITWIVQSLPYKYSEVPTPLVGRYDCNYRRQAALLFSSARATTAFGFFFHDQGKSIDQFDKDKYEVKLVPEMSKETNP